MDRATASGGSEIPYREAMERAFRVDFGDVRAYTGRPTEMDAINANAAARGEAVVFADSAPSVELVAHELTHVVQTRMTGGGHTQMKAGVSQSGDAAEVQADAVSTALAHGDFAPARALSSNAVRSARIARDLRQSTNENWADTKAAVVDKWERIEAQQMAANNDWVRTAAAEDEPSIEEQILLGVLTGAITAATGGIGGTIASAMVRNVSAMGAQAIRRAAVNAGKQIINGAAGAAIAQLGSESGGVRGAAARYKRAADATVGDVVDAEKQSTRVSLSNHDADENKWEIAQSLYDGLERSRNQAHTHQYNAMIDGWFTQLAQARVGTDLRAGPGLMDDLSSNREAWITTTNERALPGFQTSQIGVLGLHLGPQGGHPGESPTIGWAEIEGSEGNNEAIRQSLLDRPLRSIGIPKTLVTEGMQVPGYGLGGRSNGGRVSIQLDEANNWSRGSVRFGTEEDLGQTFLAQKALARFERLSDDEVQDNWVHGVRIIVDTILPMTLAGAGIDEIST